MNSMPLHKGPGYRLVIALLAKGSMNNLHREDIVSVFRSRGIEVGFLVREEQWGALERIPGCRYFACIFAPESGRIGMLKHFCRYLRSLYPVAAEGRRYTIPWKRPLRKRVSEWVLATTARNKLVMRCVRKVEKRLYSDIEVGGIRPDDLDQLMLLGVGSHGSDHESVLTWWALRHGIPVVHTIGNWDTFTSKGYPGAPVQTCLVWGPVMRRDAVELHDIPEHAIEEIGCLRYDRLRELVVEDRDTFFKRIGLDPDLKTILFAGPLSADQYFEMLAAYQEMKTAGERLQMIFRLYPHRYFLETSYAPALIHYARSLSGVYVSHSYPDYRLGRLDAAPTRIEQFELWHSLAYCDVVVNYFSTVALEAAFFDKPVVSLAYRPQSEYGWIHPPKYANHPELLHNRRLREYGNVRLAWSREELKAAIRQALAHPEANADARRRTVELELGRLDGKVAERLVDACVRNFARFRMRHS